MKGDKKMVKKETDTVVDIEALILQEKEIKRLIRGFKKDDIIRARRKLGKTTSPDVISLKEKFNDFFKSNSSIIQKVFDGTKTKKRPNGQKSLKIDTESFKIFLKRE
jgi:hypothetical protein